MANKKNTDTGIVEATGFAVLANMDILNEAMAEDCQGMEFTFDRVKLPAGGGTAFELPAADGEEAEMVKEITGVIVYNHPAYALYMDKYAGGNNPPDCGSFDGIMGVGNPGGKCADCPYNKFGSGDGQSKLCKNKRLLYILREEELFPLIPLPEPPRHLHERHGGIPPLPVRESHGGAQERHPRRGGQGIHPALPRALGDGQGAQERKPHRAAAREPEIRDEDLADEDGLHRRRVRHGKEHPDEEPRRRRRFPLRKEHPFGISRKTPRTRRKAGLGW